LGWFCHFSHRTAKCHFFDNFVEQSGALLCARIVDLMDKAGGSDAKTYTFCKDVIAAVDHNYSPSSFKGVKKVSVCVPLAA